MENVYDIRKKKKLLFVLSDKILSGKEYVNTLKSVVIVVNLYYLDSVERYLEFLLKVPKEIEIYIFSSNKDIIAKLEKDYKQKNIFILKKENRGRDISSLLVSFGKNVFNYKYVCFLHDKKAKWEFYKGDLEAWINNLWGNTISNEVYIYNILNLFETQKNIGILAPHEPLGEYLAEWYRNSWYENFDLTCDLAKKLDLKCDLNIKKPPITLGTVLWFRTEALKKLFELEWKYNDFLDEPLPNDGTISHVIERIFAYIAQDAGFYTGTVMTSEYAENLLLFLQGALTDAMEVVFESHKVKSLHQLKTVKQQKISIINFCNSVDEIYLYGAGFYGTEFLKRIKTYGYIPNGFIVSDGEKREDYVDGLKVYEFSELDFSKNIGVILTVNYDLENEIEDMLKRNNVSKYIRGFI